MSFVLDLGQFQISLLKSYKQKQKTRRKTKAKKENMLVKNMLTHTSRNGEEIIWILKNKRACLLIKNHQSNSERIYNTNALNSL